MESERSQREREYLPTIAERMFWEYIRTVKVETKEKYNVKMQRKR